MDGKGSSSRLSTPDLDQTIRKMDNHLEGFEKEDDPRQRFLLMYRTFKNELRKNLQKGRFLDHEWSEAICCRMGSMYFEAVKSYEDDYASCPESWRLSFDLSIAGKTNLLQDALMGMNAHINYDLTVCVYDVMEKYGDFHELASRSGNSSMVDRRLNSLLKKRYFDYLLINQIAWESIPIIQEVLTRKFSTLLGILNLVSSRYSRTLVEQLILNYRDRAWTHALLFLSSDTGREHNRILSFMDTLAVSNLRLIQKFISYNPLNLVYHAFRYKSFREEHDAKLDPATAALLKDKLFRRETSKYAYHTLVEYGNNALPYLCEWLEEQDDGQEMEKQIYAILSKINTKKAAQLLSEELSADAPPSYEILNALWCLDRKHIQAQFADDIFRDVVDEYLEKYFQVMRLAEDLSSFGQDSLLQITLRDRMKWQWQRLEIACRIILVFCGLPKKEAQSGVDQYYAILAEILGQKRSKLLQQVIEGRDDRLLDRAGKLFPLYKKTQSARIKELMEGKDEWIKLCIYQATDADDVSQISTEKVEDSTMISTVEKVLYLKHVELFNEIPAEELTGIAKVAEYESFEEGDYVIRQDQPGKNLHIITEGSVKVVQNGSVVAKLGKGDVLGEMSILTDSDTSADCLASMETQTLRLNQENFLNFLYEGYPEIALGLIKVLAQRLVKTTSQLRSR